MSDPATARAFTAAARVVIGLALLAASAVGAADAPPETGQTIVHTLDYVAVDYGGAVENGKVKSEDEYKEMVEFTARVSEELPKLPPNPRRAGLAAQATALAGLVAGKASAGEVAAAASRLRWDL